MQTLETDILILGAGGAGLFAALHAKKANPDLHVTIAVKGLLGKCGCTRMVQGGYNVALSPEDSVERHFMDTIEGGGWLNDQDLAWLLVSTAPRRIRELETELGCFFDRNPDGTVHQKAFAGQTFDRTVHKGDLTGIEIINRLAEQVWRRDVHRLEDHRALDFIPSADGSELAGVLMLDMRSGELSLVRARATLLATGGGPTMYRYHTPSGDKSCDGLAMALRAGLPLRDIEMVQFHPTGLLAGEGTRMTGTVLEEGLRGSGGYLTDSEQKRFMFDYDKRGERATRDIVSRSIMDRIRKGFASPHGGVYIEMGHLGPDRVRREFKGMVERCADCGFDLAAGRVEVIPTAHYMMGGVKFAADCTTPLAAALCGGRGHRRRARRQPARRQRRRQLHRVRRRRRRRHGCAHQVWQAALPDPDMQRHRGRARARLRAARPQARPSAGDARTALRHHVERRRNLAHRRKPVARRCGARSTRPRHRRLRRRRRQPPL